MNDAPMAAADSLNVNEGESAQILVLNNDTDPDQDALIVGISTVPSNGTVTVNPDNSIVYTHDGSETLSDSFVYSIDDGNGGSDSATVNVIVAPINDIPIAQPDSVTLSYSYQTKDQLGAVSLTTNVTISITPTNDTPIAVNDNSTVAEAGTVTLAVLSNDSDADLDNLTVSIISNPGNGFAIVNADNTISYTHDGSNNASDAFIYSVNDGNGASASAQVDISVNLTNDVPVGLSDTLTVNEGQGGTVDILLNDSDEESLVLQPSIIGLANNGTVSLNTNGSINYVHDGSETASDIFHYVVTDPDGAVSSPIAVVVTINAVNDAPLATDDTLSVAEGASATLSVLANDTDAELDSLSVQVTTAPANGATVVNADNSITYTHDGTETTSDSLVYTISDGNGGVDTATVTISVSPVNQAPIAINDSGSVNEGGSSVIDVLQNDSDAEASALTATLASTPTNGSAVINVNGTITYNHDGSETTNDSFSYFVTDNQGAVSGIATVNLSVTAVNDVPVANDDNATLPEAGQLTIDVLGNDQDNEQDNLSVQLLSTPNNGNVIVNTDNTLQYLHDGSETLSDTFTYGIDDGNGGADTAIVSISITPVNDAPQANSDQASLDEGGTVSVNVLINDSDPENESLTSALLTPSQNGLVSLNSDNSFTYTHNGSETLTDSFTYQITDLSGATATAVVDIATFYLMTTMQKTVHCNPLLTSIHSTAQPASIRTTP